MTIRTHLAGPLLALLVVACGASSVATTQSPAASPSVAAPVSATAAAVASAAAASPSEPPAPSASAPASASPSIPALRLVGLGDSYMSAQNAKGESFMDVYAAALEKKLGRKVRLTLLTSNNATTMTVRQGLADGGKYRSEVAGADVIVLSVGGNDSDPFGMYPKGTCAPQQPLPACLKAYAPMLTANYEAILGSIAALRAGKPTALRVTSMDDPFVGSPDAPSKTFARDFARQIAAAETAAIFAVGKAHGAQPVDYLRMFSGPDGLSDPAQFLAADHGHPGAVGIQAIADELMRLGVPELK
jgi:lysophospholipase L1-like esterase